MESVVGDYLSKRYTILIGGVPGVGKSSISGELAREFDFNILLSGDYLREFYRSYVPKEHEINTSVYQAWTKFGEKNESNVLKGFLSQSESMAAGIKGIISRASANGEYLALETLYFVPSLFEDMLKETIPLYLYIREEKDHRESLNSRINFTHFNSPGERLSERLWEYRIMMNYSLKESAEYGIRTFDMSDYLSSKKKVIEYIGSELEQ